MMIIYCMMMMDIGTFRPKASRQIPHNNVSSFGVYDLQCVLKKKKTVARKIFKLRSGLAKIC